MGKKNRTEKKSGGGAKPAPLAKTKLNSNKSNKGGKNKGIVLPKSKLGINTMVGNKIKKKANNGIKDEINGNSIEGGNEVLKKKKEKKKKSKFGMEGDNSISFSNLKDQSDVLLEILDGGSEEEVIDSEEEELDQVEKLHMENINKKEVDLVVNKTRSKLPVKDASGKLIEVSDSEEEEEEERLDYSDDSEVTELEFNTSDEEEVEEKVNNENKVEKIDPKVYLKTKMELMANLAQAILEDPEANYSELKQFKDLSNDSNLQVRKYSYLTQLSIFKDILPSYKIRPLTEEEKGLKVSKEVQRLRSFEEYLVSSYQSYLAMLTYHYKALVKTPSHLRDNTHVEVIVKCFCDLMLVKQEFNFEIDVINFVSKRLVSRVDDNAYQICIKATEDLFINDEVGSSSLMLAQAIAKSAKAREYKVQPSLILTFLKLKLTEANTQRRNKWEDQAKPKNKYKEEERMEVTRKRRIQLDNQLTSERKQHISKKAKKRRKMDRDIEKEMEESQVEVSKEIKQKAHTDMLTTIFVIFFRILKHAADPTLLPPVLENLAKFGHLISVDFFTDLLKVLETILTDGLNKTSAPSTPAQDLECRILCISAAFRLLSGQGMALNLDLVKFYSHFYKALPFIAVTHSTQVLDATLVAFDQLFFKRRDVPLSRVAAFVKRLSSLSYNVQPPYHLKFLNMIKAFVMKYPGLDRLLTSEDRGGEGHYQPYSEDPDQCQALQANLLELTYLTHCHYDPKSHRLAEDVVSASRFRTPI